MTAHAKLLNIQWECHCIHCINDNGSIMPAKHMADQKNPEQKLLQENQSIHMFL